MSLLDGILNILRVSIVTQALSSQFQHSGFAGTPNLTHTHTPWTRVLSESHRKESMTSLVLYLSCIQSQDNVDHITYFCFQFRMERKPLGPLLQNFSVLLLVKTFLGICLVWSGDHTWALLSRLGNFTVGLSSGLLSFCYCAEQEASLSNYLFSRTCLRGRVSFLLLFSSSDCTFLSSGPTCFLS